MELGKLRNWSTITAVAVGIGVASLLWMINRRKLRYTNGKVVPGIRFDNPIHLSKLEPTSVFLVLDNLHKLLGSVYQFGFLTEHILVVSDSEMIRKILGDTNFNPRVDFWSVKEAFQDKGILFTNDDEHHRVHRALALKGLMKTNILRAASELLDEKVQILLKDIRENMKNEESIFCVGSKIHGLALDVVGKVAFSTEFGAYQGNKSQLQLALENTIFTMVDIGRVPKFLIYFTQKYANWKKDYSFSLHKS